MNTFCLWSLRLNDMQHMDEWFMAPMNWLISVQYRRMSSRFQSHGPRKVLVFPVRAIALGGILFGDLQGRIVVNRL